MLLAEELALVARKPESGRHQIGTGDALNACLAGLLVAELLLEPVGKIVRRLIQEATEVAAATAAIGGAAAAGS